MAALHDTPVATLEAPAAAKHGTMTMPGDAMRPTIEDGDELAVDLRDTRVHSGGGIFVVDLEGRPAVRRLSRTTTGAWVIHCDNREYRDEKVPAGSVRVLGRVVAFRGLRPL